MQVAQVTQRPSVLAAVAAPQAVSAEQHVAQAVAQQLAAPLAELVVAQ